MSETTPCLPHVEGPEPIRRIGAEERVVAGPELPSFDATRRRVLGDPVVKRALLTEAARSGAGLETVEAAAAAHFDEIAARYSPRVTSLFAAAMNAVFDRIFDGIVVDETGLARAIEASRRSPLVFCPSHKSHVDYLVLSLVLWNHGVTPPHIAAGANLSFFPLGSLLRGSGAFFLRRSFRDDPVYSAVFRAYVVELVRRGTALEFFVEGTRSRTGKVLMPRLGLLSFAVDAWRRGASDDIQFVPVSLDYERIIESASHERELMGEEKSPEGMAALLRAGSVLRSRYGRVYLQFGEPVSLAALAREKGLPPSPSPERDEAWRAEVHRLGYRVLHQVATIATVTSSAVAAAVLLGDTEGCIRESSLLARGREILGHLDAVAARLSAPLADPTAWDRTLLEAVRRFVEDGHVAADRRERGDPEPVYRLAGERRMALDLYKNTLMNHLAGAAIVCCALRRNAGQGGRRDVHRDAGFLFQLFSREFFRCADSSLEACVDDHLSRLALLGCLGVHGNGRIVVLEPARTSLLAGLLDVFVEGYWVVASTLAEHRFRPLARADLVGRAMERARSGVRDGRITRPECANQTLLQNAVEWLLVTRVVERHGTAGEETLRLGPEREAGGLERLIHDIGLFL